MARFDQHVRFDSQVRFDTPPSPSTSQRKPMAKVKLELDGKNGQEVVNASSAHIAAIATPEGLALFSNPDPSVVDYLVPHNALAVGVNQVTSLEGQLIAARAAVPGLITALKTAMEARAVYVETITKGDPSKIPVSGFSVASTTAQPIGPLPRPENVKATMALMPGVIRVSCEPIKGTQSYLIEFREHVEGSTWQQVKVSTKSRNDITGLVSGKSYAFRIAAVGAAGQSPWSDEAVCMAP